MSNIVIENIQRRDGEAISLVEEIDSLLEQIQRYARRLTGTREACRLFEQWLQIERDKFWTRQVNLTEGEQCFRIRMAVPSPDAEQLRVTVSPAGIEVHRSAERGDDGEGANPGELVRQVTLSAPVDARSVTATFDRGELRLAGATLRSRPKKRATDLTQRKQRQEEQARCLKVGV
jgi:HSP20 family molecular chaperone IbpA